MTAETSNARGELRMADIREDAREPLKLLREKLVHDEDGWAALCQLMPMIAAAPPPAAAQQQGQPVAWVSEADIAPFVGAPQMAAFWGTVTLASGPGDGRTVPLYLTAPPSAPVGVEAIREAFDEISGLCRHLRQGGPAPEDLQDLSDALDEAVGIAANMLHALAQQPAAVDEAMVERACKAALDEVWPDTYEDADDLRAMIRRILSAALATQHQEPTT